MSGNGETCLATTDASEKDGGRGHKSVMELVEILDLGSDSRPLKEREEDEEEGPEEDEKADSARSRLLPEATALPSTSSNGHANKELRTESIWMTFIQVCVPFLIAGFGTVAAGRLLDEVQVCACVCACVGACVCVCVCMCACVCDDHG